MYALNRNITKFAQRDRRVQRCQHVEFSPEGKSFRMRVWGRTVDTRLFDPAIDRVI